MKILEGLTIISFFAGVIVAENIPLCAVCFGICFACGIAYKILWTRGMKK